MSELVMKYGVVAPAPRYTDDEMRERFLIWRGIPEGHECQDCGGAGVKLYGDGSTWRGGPAGQVLTTDVCDRCWGSGSRYRPGVDLRRALANANRVQLLEKRVASLEKELALAQKPKPSRKRFKG